MDKKRGFVLIESIFMIVFISVALLLVYKAFSISFQDESKRVSYDNTNSIYETYYLKQYFEETGILDYLAENSLTDGYLEIDCDTLASNNTEYCDFLVSADNFDINKMYITKEDMDGIDYANLEPTTIDYFKTLSNVDSSSYRFIVWFNNGDYASLKLGEPFYILRVLLDGGTWNGISPKKLNEGSITTITEPTKEGFIFNGWTLSGTGSSLDGTTFTMGTADTLLVATWQLPEYNFVYTGSYQTFTAPATGYYKLETWGAQGGIKVYAGTIYNGYGGFSTGTVYLEKNQVVYVYVGGQGNTTTLASTIVAGGYNGGGQGYSYSDSRGGASGGGATHIATDSGLLSTLSSNQSAILIVAGGGGGADQCCAGYVKYAGNGGGHLGTDGLYNSVYVIGGSQLTGGTGSFSGSFGQGANCESNDCAGGGGGFYGGGARTGGGGFGAGGSSYIANSLLLSYGSLTKSTSCYNCATSSAPETMTYTTTNVSETPTVNYAKSGSGYAKITYLGNN